MKLALLVSLLLVSCGVLDAFNLTIGTRLLGDQLLRSWRLSAGPYATPQTIQLTFDYRVEPSLFGPEHLTVMEFTRPDDYAPNNFGQMFLNSTHLYMTPLRHGMTEWWLDGKLYGISGQLFQEDEN
ncbi:hypothetical protein quinque_013289 [Culex quinquefasciatus]